MTQRDYIAEIKEVRARLGPVPSRWAQVSARLDNLVDSWHDIQYLRAKNEVINDELLRYFPIGFVACIEGYFRLVYRDLIDFGTPYRENAAQFKDIKLRIEHAVSIQSNSATLGEFITHLLQANSLQDINSNMSVLIGEDYLGRLKRTRFSVLGDRMTLTEKGLEGRLFRDIEGLFRLRHILCHEVVAFEPIDYDEIQVFSLASTTFLLLNESLVKELLVDENKKPGDREVALEERDSVSAYPSLIFAMLQTRTAEAGRVWMVCRYLDEEGRGWVYIEDLKRYLTRSESSLQLVAAKEFETILREGDGLFWNLDNQGRLWLAGLARVASSLNIERVWKAQRLPIKQIIQGLSQYRLHSFAASYLNRPSKPFRVNE